MWFTRIQQPIVIGAWYASQGIGIGLGGLIGYGIGQIDAALAAWRYEFIIIGAACAAWGITMAVIIPDSPYTTKRFTRDEKVVIMSRKREDYHAVEKRQLKWDQVSRLGFVIASVENSLVPDQRVRPGHPYISLLPSRTYRQHSQRWDLQFRNSHDPRVWLQHSSDYSAPDSLRSIADFVHVGCCPLASKARLADEYQRSVNLGQLQDPSPQHPNLLDGVCPALHRRR